jgi:hypothetical protein
LGNIILNPSGYSNALFDIGISGAKKPYLPMSIELLINNPPPPLILLINPSNLDRAMTKKISYQRVRANGYNRGFSIQHHHDELDVMTVSGISAMAYSKNYGISAISDRSSAAYDNWSKLLAMFRNNGVNYNRRENNVIDSMGNVSIKYDGWDYRGSFDDLSMAETQDNPFNFTFDWTFTITETINTFTPIQGRNLRGLTERNVLRNRLQ